MILDEDGKPFDHRDHCEVAAYNVLCQSHLRKFTGHTDDNKPVCDWYAGMWIHDIGCAECAARKEVINV